MVFKRKLRFITNVSLSKYKIYNFLSLCYDNFTNLKSIFLLGKQFIFFNLCVIFVMYILFMKSIEEEASKTSIMIQHFNKIINNNIDIKGTNIEKYEEMVLDPISLVKEVCKLFFRILANKSLYLPIIFRSVSKIFLY